MNKFYGITKNAPERHLLRKILRYQFIFNSVGKKKVANKSPDALKSKSTIFIVFNISREIHPFSWISTIGNFSFKILIAFKSLFLSKLINKGKFPRLNAGMATVEPT